MIFVAGLALGAFGLVVVEVSGALLVLNVLRNAPMAEERVWTNEDDLEVARLTEPGEAA